MTSDARIAANRRNAAASTGPNTLEGKEISRGNALRHGLSARNPVALGEDEAAFERYCDAMAKSLNPQNAVEAALVHRVAMCGWRLERLYQVEAALFDERSRRVARVRNGGEGVALDAWPEEMSSLARYEAMLDRGFQRALAELERRRTGSARLHIPEKEKFISSPLEAGENDPGVQAACRMGDTAQNESPAALAAGGSSPAAPSREEEAEQTSPAVPANLNFTKRSQSAAPAATDDTDFTKRSQHVPPSQDSASEKHPP